MESQAMEVALRNVRPLCMQLVQSPNAKHVQAIIKLLKSFDKDVVKGLQQFIIFPLRTILVQYIKQSLPEELLVETCTALEVLFSKAQLQQPAVFMDLFSTLSILIFFDNNGSNNAAPRCLSEEEKMAVVQALCALITGTDDKALHNIYTPGNIARLGSLVSQLVTFVSDTKASRSLRCKAMDTLLVLMQRRTYGLGKDTWHHGNRFAGLLPGMSSTMLKVLLGDSKQGHQIFCKALEVWSEVVCLTLGDQSLQLEQQAGHAWMDNLKLSGQVKELVTKRDKDWVAVVLPRVELMIKQISKLKKNDNWKVRQSLAVCGSHLLDLCKTTLVSCQSLILEVLVLLMTDSYTQVATPAKVALERYRDEQNSVAGCQPLVELLKENLYALVTSLPRRIKMEDEEEKSAVIGLLNGYISMLGSNMSALLLSLPHVTRLARVLVQVMELDVADQKILEESGMGARGSADVSKFLHRVTVMKPRKVFVHFRDDNVKSGLFHSCRLLGFHGELNIMVESFLDIYRESATYQLPCVLIISEILCGHGEKTAEDRTSSSTKEVIRMLLEEYLSYDNMTLTENDHAHPTASPHSPSSSSVTSTLSSLHLLDDECGAAERLMMNKRNRAIMLTCLFLEGIGVCAQVLGRKFRLMLMDVLYPVVEKMGSQVSAISSTAYLTLDRISQACEYSSLDALIEKNADYLVNSVSLRLRHFHRHKRAPSVLSVMLQICTINILPLVWDSILEVLETLDENHADQAAIFLPVLHQLTLAVAQWFPTQKNKHSIPKTTAISSGSKLDPEEITKLLLERRRQRLEAEAYDEEPLPEDPSTMQEEAAKMAEKGDGQEEGVMEKKETPLHVKAVKEVLQRARHLVSSSDPRLTLLALDIIAQGCYDLADHQNDLLPIVHEVWQPFKERFKDPEKVVVIKAVKTLHSICSCSGEFVRYRVEKDVLPTVKSFLEKQAQISWRCGNSYHITVNFKLQLTLLSMLGDTALTIDLDGAGLERVVYCCLPYLSQHQPSKLQQACMECLKQLMVCDVDIVWLALSTLYTPAPLVPPSGNFRPVKAFRKPGEANDYSTNVSSLLHYMDSSLKPDTKLP